MKIYLTRDQILARCCADDDDDDEHAEHTAAQHQEAFELAVEYYTAHPVACGGPAKALAKHQREAGKYVIAELKRRHAGEPTGFGFDPASVWLVWQIVSTLWSLWSWWTADES